MGGVGVFRGGVERRGRIHDGADAGRIFGLREGERRERRVFVIWVSGACSMLRRRLSSRDFHGNGSLMSVVLVAG